MGTTTNLGLPYPDAADPFALGNEQIQALAEELDDQLYTPWLDGGNFSGVTIGNGSQKTRYRVHGKTVQVQGALLLGSTSDVTGLLSTTLPGGVVMASPLALTMGIEIPVGVAFAFDSSATGRQFGEAVCTPGSGQIYFRKTATAEGGWGSPDTVPFTWATGDYLTFTAMFEIA
jgi:hypothetical protein